MRAALEAALKELFGPGELLYLQRIPGGASKEAWVLDYRVGERVYPLFLRRAGGGVIQRRTLPLATEFRLLEAAHAHGVRVARPLRYFPDLEDREAFLMERLEGESIGTRVVRRPELQRTRQGLPQAMAEELAKIHRIPQDRLPPLPGPGEKPAHAWILEELYMDLDALEEPHPALEWGLRWLQDHPPRPLSPVLVHGDFRIGNLMVDGEGLVAVLDWEFAHLGDPREDLAWPLVRAWRFGEDGKRLGGVGEVEPFLARYNALTGREIAAEELLWWEILGNVRWGLGALNQARRHLKGEERSVELAVLGRLAAEMEYEVLHLLERYG
ncbi:phosphotransferase family protein [Thermus thermamylovorans]|uniref:Phosphotransferase family protein n=1 Tax=Thermus thermamylovorans TaxID=2509362 RepID=A0A4Q9B6S0_9DEIN|nr:phosphotransferase family protein [Thermus thermamylovorans]TBH21824.1 phosphotransferase family protein [Thermus thermamylovorans]